ncbi:ErfK/YbiS/YcfS/YnhG family protein [Salinisphaera sp. PC39]|uniref:L,D-transpeptidase family protein n=1 Tax=Salinisphaera sp. PC39 TaxID=1304156 RepID=UPI003342A6F2
MRAWILVCLLLCMPAVEAAVYDRPAPGNDVIGEVREIRTRAQDTLVDVARRHDIGYRELRLANPHVDPWLPGEGTRVVLPTRYVLPDAPREGLVLNLSEMRLYYYPAKDSPYAGKVITYPLGIGREGRSTPLGETRIVRTADRPTWYPPASIRKEHAEDGDPLPRVVPPGPDNPLGEYALYLGFPSYLIHGTNKPAGIGMRVSSGCIRLYPEDIAALYSMVDAGTTVRIIDQPYKAGWLDGTLYVEAHPPDANGRSRVGSYTPLVKSVIAATRQRPDFPVDWNLAQNAAETADGVPVSVGNEQVASKTP